MKKIGLKKVYQLLEPGPVILLSTAHKGRYNVMTQSWHLMMEFEPPRIGIVISDANYSFQALKSNRECAINIPTYKLLDAVVGCGNTSRRYIDKFEKFNLTPLCGRSVAAPLIKECFASLECKVIDSRLVKQYGFFVLEVTHAWGHGRLDRSPKTLHHRGNGLFMIAGRSVQTRSKMK